VAGWVVSCRLVFVGGVVFGPVPARLLLSVGKVTRKAVTGGDDDDGSILIENYRRPGSSLVGLLVDIRWIR